MGSKMLGNRLFEVESLPKHSGYRRRKATQFGEPLIANLVRFRLWNIAHDGEWSKYVKPQVWEEAGWSWRWWEMQFPVNDMMYGVGGVQRREI
jgi:hypothetical protein